MKFIITFILFFGYVFADDMLCSEIKEKMQTFKYNYNFSLKSFKNREYSCEVHPNLIEEKLYLLFICRSSSALDKKIIFASECNGEIKSVSDINWTLAIFLKFRMP